MKLQSLLLAAAIAVALALSACSAQPSANPTEATVTLTFPSDKFPETGTHIRDAINAGESAVCTIDRPDEAAHRKLSLKDVPTRKGYDRDEWPMAMCKEGGSGANVRYINPSDNRGAGAWVSGQLKQYPDGTAVKFIVK